MSLTIDTLHVYWDRDERYRWAFRSSNGPILADSGQGYTDKRAALHGFAIINRAQPGQVPSYQLERCPHHRRVCDVYEIPRIELRIHDLQHTRQVAQLLGTSWLRVSRTTDGDLVTETIDPSKHEVILRSRT